MGGSGWTPTLTLGTCAQIKVGHFKDGLDMSAIREVKFLRELRHPNVIEASTPDTRTSGRRG